MRIVLCDRDRLSTHILAAKLHGWGHHALVETSPPAIVEMLSSHACDMVIIDPAPLASAKPLAIELRRARGAAYAYLMIYAKTPEKDFAGHGINEALRKPMDPTAFRRTLEGATWLIDLVKRVTFPVAGDAQPGLLSHQALAELLIGELDKCHRGGERRSLLKVRVTNSESLRADPDSWSQTLDELGAFLAKFRRRSDLCGQVADDEYLLFLHNTPKVEQTLVAARRLAMGLEWQSSARGDRPAPQFSVQALSLPSGEAVADFAVGAGQLERQIV